MKAMISGVCFDTLYLPGRMGEKCISTALPLPRLPDRGPVLVTSGLL